MCRISVTCCCHTRSNSGGGLAVLAVGALVLVAAAPVIVAAVHAAVDLLTAVIIGVVVAAGVIVLGWIIKSVAVAVIEDRSLRRHNERMAQRFPHLREQLPPPRETRRRVRVERVHTPMVIDGPPPIVGPAVLAAPVTTSPTRPRAVLPVGQNRGVA